MSFTQQTIPGLLKAMQTRDVSVFELNRLKEEVKILSELRDRYIDYMNRYRTDDQLRISTLQRELLILQDKLEMAKNIAEDHKKREENRTFRESAEDCDTYGHMFWRMREAQERAQELQFVLE
jgi:hypothetical protein